MPQRRRPSRFQTRTPAATSSIESLENRQLLSATAGGGDQVGIPLPHDYCSSTQVDVAAGHQRICVSEVVGDSGHSLTIEEVWEVGDELWVLSRLSRAEVGATVVTTVKEELTVESGISQHRHFRIGGRGWDTTDDLPSVIPRPHRIPTLVESQADFHSRISDRPAKQLWGASDPQLAQWREAHRERLIAEADESYGDLFGTPSQPVWYTLEGREIALGTGSFLSAMGLPTAIDFADLTVSDTNVQVDGIDEADIVETDGEFIYMIADQELVVVRANATVNDDPEVVSRTKFSLRPDALFLHDARLTVISRMQHDASRVLLSRFPGDIIPRVNLTTVTVFDVTDPAAPYVTQESVIDGRYVTARAIGSDVYLVVNNTGIPHLPALQVVWDEVDDSSENQYRYQTRQEFIARLDEVLSTSAPPAAYRRTAGGDLTRIGWLDESALRSDQVTLSGSVTNVVRFNTALRDPGPVDNVSVATGNIWQTHVYASENAIYLLTPEIHEFRNDGLVFRFDQRETATLIHRINLQGGQMELDASGRVQGTVESQFSVDEYGGFLRVATTTGALWNQTSANHVWILEPRDGRLELVGSLEDLAPTEKIYSMRFDGDRAWMVTFRKVDPVFALDLSDPAAPRVTGELKIPGYSDYLQLIGENHLLAIGRGTSDSGSPQFALFEEVQVSLFDISDKENPELLHRFSFEGGRQGQSEALIDHHAFHYIPDRQLLAIPFRSPAPGRWTWDAGLITLHIDPDNGISKVGDVDQPGSVRRSVRIAEQLFGISDHSISVLDLNSPNEIIGNVDLQDTASPVRQHDDLLRRYLQRVNDIHLTRFTNRRLGADHIVVGIGDRPNDWNQVLQNAATGETEYEFLIRDSETGNIWQQIVSRRPWVLLQNPTEILSTLINFGSANTQGHLPDRIAVQFRTRNALREGAAWSPWSHTETIVVNAGPAVMSAATMTSDDALLHWTEVAERGVAEDLIEPRTSLPTLNGNPLSHYEVWITDATTRRRVLWDRDVHGTELDLSQLAPGRLWVWVRAAFQDGSFGDWSDGTAVHLLGRKLSFLSSPDATANQNPTFEWEHLSNAVGYELEVTSPDGSSVVYSTTSLIESRHSLRQSLDPGSYRVRVRAMLNGVHTEWSDAIEFTIADRPTLSVQNESISWNAPGAERFEVWVNDSDTGERIFHSREWTETYLENPGPLVGKTRGKLDIWVKAYMPDGTATKWSGKAVATIFAPAVSVNPIDSFRHGQIQELSWMPYEAMVSAEIYISRKGEPRAVYRASDITGTTHVLSQSLPVGEYSYWIRGLLSDGTRTRWGRAQTLTVSSQPFNSMNGDHVVWTTGPRTVSTEIWINRLDDFGRLLESRVAHFTDLTDDRFSLYDFENGTYAIWTRTREMIDGVIRQSDWSDRLLVVLSRPPGVSLAPHADALGETLLDLLDRI